MKSLKTKICEYTLYESELNEGFYKNAGGIVRPSTKDELKNEIRIRLDRGQYNFNDIDTSKIDDMSFLFSDSDMYYKIHDKDFDVSGWDTSNVTNMNSLFQGCVRFNCDISKWNVGKVKYMSRMFQGCLSFN